jgi:lipoprotein-anchoring transpeptidase ErfK/SrfK
MVRFARTGMRATARVLPALLLVTASGLLAACSEMTLNAGQSDLRPEPAAARGYAAIATERFPVPAVEDGAIAPKFRRQIVRYASGEPPGTVIVDPNAKYLYLVMANGDAMRYGIGVGREGFGWSGVAAVERKAPWPTWTPPQSMIGRQPELARYARGMAPGLDNPLGARALYLFQNGRDTLYRIHGTNEPDSIGQNVSSGCIRLLNQDVVDLYNRVPVGSKVVVLKEQPNQPSIRQATGGPQ